MRNSSSYRGTVDTPIIGDIRQGRDVNKKATSLYIWQACEICSMPRWVRYRVRDRKPLAARCKHCIDNTTRGMCGDKNKSWRGGKTKNGEGYISIWIDEHDFFYPMCHARSNKTGRILEHRLVMAKHLGRCLQRWEVVHHKNGIRDDNRIDNLEITNSTEHIIAHNKGYRDGYIKGYKDGHEKQIRELKSILEEQLKQIRLLQWNLRDKCEVSDGQ